MFALLLFLAAAGPAEGVIEVTVTEGGRPVVGAIVEVKHFRMKTVDVGRPSRHLPTWKEEYSPEGRKQTTDREGRVRFTVPHADALDAVESFDVAVEANGLPAVPEPVRPGDFGRGVNLTPGVSFTVPRTDRLTFSAECRIARPEVARVKVLTLDGEPAEGDFHAVCGWIGGLPCRREGDTLVVPLIDFWSNMRAFGMNVTPPLKPPAAIRVQTAGHLTTPQTQYSDPVAFDALATTDLLVLQVGRSVTGRLDDSVPRPVRSGYVTAAALSGTPLSPLPVYVHAPVRPDGSFVLEGVPFDRWLAVSVWAEGHCSGPSPTAQAVAADSLLSESALIGDQQVLDATGDSEYVLLFSPEEADEELIIPMRPGGGLRLSVRNEAGQPLGGANVTLFAARDSLPGLPYFNPNFTNRLPDESHFGSVRYEATTDADGVAAFEVLPSAVVSNVEVVLPDDNPLELPCQSVEDDKPIRVPPGEVVEHTLVVRPPGALPVPEETPGGP